MARLQTRVIDIQDLGIWKTVRQKRIPLGFDLELTARCNLNCRHCYINLPATEFRTAANELKTKEIYRIAEQAVELGALWCSLTGGEPLLRPDFKDIYLALKKLGLLVTVHTNATLVGDEQVELFRNYPPRDIEVTVYGTSAETYERVSRIPGSYERFRKGLQRLIDGRVKVRLKAMALRSNLNEMKDIAKFCRKQTKDYFRFDPLLHLRIDRNQERNVEIMAERLLPVEVARLEREDPERFDSLMKGCGRLIEPIRSDHSYDECLACSKSSTCEHFDRMTRLITCGAGNSGFYIAHDGSFRLCASLCTPGTTYDLRNGTLKEAWEKFAPAIRDLRIDKGGLLKKCHSCAIINLCMNCPALAYLETGVMEEPVTYFCEVARARRKNLEEPKEPIIGMPGPGNT
ncbi:MAG: radical SAM protein [Acidobacteria bacterium]|nr:radical SAM protein [Acidobacteriota bacterium]MBU4307241.1 radical SAM protein [Acidobacteriota bacterium]MBU4405033.1 radical SAM protein [Acidobacteriota bacterium]MCG2811476.1 radical SAM protein [Candidatus Aminicenantes bacterium]